MGEINSTRYQNTPRSEHIRRRKEDASDRIENRGASSSTSGAGEAWASTQHAVPPCTIGNHRNREAVFIGSYQEQEPRDEAQTAISTHHNSASLSPPLSSLASV